MKNIQITEWYRSFLKQQIHPGDLCIDATMGNGNDTLLLCQLAGEQGHCLAFDIQPEALCSTQKLLQENRIPQNSYTLLPVGHEHMADYAQPETVSAIVFNLGYLPSGDHTLATQASTTLQALEQSLLLLKKEGLLVTCIYSGGDSGFEERDAVLSWLKNLNPKKYLVIVSQYYNRPKNPPIPVLVIKL